MFYYFRVAVAAIKSFGGSVMHLAKLKGEILIIVAAILWGTLGVAGKLAYGYGCTPGQLMLYRMLFIFPAIIYVLLRAKREHIKYLLLFGAIIVTPFYLIYFYAVKFVGASTAALILYTAPAYVAVMSAVFLKEKLNKIIVFSLIMALCGAALVNLGEIVNLDLLGIFTAFSAALLYAMYIITAKALISKGMASESVALVPYLSSIPILLAYALIVERHVLLDNLKQALLALYLSLIPTGLAYVLYNIGLRSVQASRASILSTIEPVSATILAWIFLGESITILKALGAALIVTSAIIVTKAQDQSGSSSQNVSEIKPKTK